VSSRSSFSICLSLFVFFEKSPFVNAIELIALACLYLSFFNNSLCNCDFDRSFFLRNLESGVKAETYSCKPFLLGDFEYRDLCERCFLPFNFRLGLPYSDVLVLSFFLCFFLFLSDVFGDKEFLLVDPFRFFLAHRLSFLLTISEVLLEGSPPN